MIAVLNGRMEYRTFTRILIIASILFSIIPPLCLASFFKVLPAKFSPTFYNTILEYKANIKNQENDIVFFGDSSCLNGVMPDLIEKETGLKTINLGLSAFTGIMGYDLILSRYLKNNKKPKLVIFYVAPNSPNCFQIMSYYDSILINTKYFNFASYYRFFPNYNPFNIPSAAITFFTNYNASTKNYNEVFNLITKNKGYFPNENVLDDNAVLDSSTITKQFFDTKMDPRKLIKKFLDHFSNQGIKIIFYLSPMTEGDLAYNFFTDKYKGLACNEIKRYPNNFFADYVHMSINGAKENSYQLAKFIKEYAF